MLKGRKQYINGVLNRISIVFVASLPTPARMLVKRKMLDKGIVKVNWNLFKFKQVLRLTRQTTEK